MREICIPISDFGDDEIAEVTLTVGQKKLSYSFKVESFPWNLDESLDHSDDSDVHHASPEQIMMLRGALAGYDKSWELVQIYTPRKDAKHIQVLYRKKNH